MNWANYSLQKLLLFGISYITHVLNLVHSIIIALRQKKDLCDAANFMLSSSSPFSDPIDSTFYLSQNTRSTTTNTTTKSVHRKYAARVHSRIAHGSLGTGWWWRGWRRCRDCWRLTNRETTISKQQTNICSVQYIPTISECTNRITWYGSVVYGKRMWSICAERARGGPLRLFILLCLHSLHSRPSRVMIYLDVEFVHVHALRRRFCIFIFGQQRKKKTKYGLIPLCGALFADACTRFSCVCVPLMHFRRFLITHSRTTLRRMRIYIKFDGA